MWWWPTGAIRTDISVPANIYVFKFTKHVEIKTSQFKMGANIYHTKNICGIFKADASILLFSVIQFYRAHFSYSPIVNSFEVSSLQEKIVTSKVSLLSVDIWVLLSTVDFYHWFRNFTLRFAVSLPIVLDKLADILLNCTSLIAFQSSRNRKSSNMADINIVGVVAIVVFYMLILGVGLWAAWRRKEGEEEAMLAGRSIGMVVGTFTLTGNIKMYLQHIVELRFSFLTSDYR